MGGWSSLQLCGIVTKALWCIWLCETSIAIGCYSYSMEMLRSRREFVEIGRSLISHLSSHMSGVMPYLAYAKLLRKLGIRTYLYHRLICM
jgi:hypothetical protein